MTSLFGPALLILRNDLRLRWREFRAGRWRALGSAGLIGVVLVIVQAIAFFVLHSLRGGIPAQAEVIAWAFFGMMMVGSAMHHAIGLLFERSDFDLLLSSPIPPHAVLLARIASIAANAMFGVGLLLFPLINAAVVTQGARYLFAYPAWLALGVLAGSSGVGLALILVRLLGARRARVAVQVVGAVLGASVYLSTQLPRFLPKGTGTDLADWLGRIAQHPAVAIPARAAHGEFAPALILSGIALAAVALQARLLARTFLTGLQDAPISPARKGGNTRHRWTEGLIAATVRKELRLIRRDPLLIAQVLPSALYFIPALAGVGTQVGLGVLAPLSVAIAGQFALVFTAVCAAGEEGWDLIRMSPVDEPRMRLGKLIAGVAIPVLLATLLNLVLVAIGLGWVALVALPTAVGVAAAAGWLQVTDVRPTLRKDVIRSRSSRSLARSLVSSALVLCGALGAGFIAADIWIAGLICVGLTWLGVVACFALVEVKMVNLEPDQPAPA